MQDNCTVYGNISSHIPYNLFFLLLDRLDCPDATKEVIVFKSHGRQYEDPAIDVITRLNAVIIIAEEYNRIQSLDFNIIALSFTRLSRCF